MTELSAALQLDQSRQATDKLMANLYKEEWNPKIRENLLTSYLGFAFWDVITFAIMGSKEQGEFNEIRINRISPKDSCLLGSDPNASLPLKGVAMKNFGAFFNRRDRENDYLWGRLNGAERLIDIIYSEAQAAKLDHRFNLMALKKKAFHLILDTEEDNMDRSDNLISRLRQRIQTL